MVKPPYPFATDVIGRFGIAGTMAANHTGLQWGTVRMAWVLTLPVSMMLAGFLFWGFRNIFWARSTSLRYCREDLEYFCPE